MSDNYMLDLDSLQPAIHKSLSTWGELSSTEEELLGFLLLVRARRESHGNNSNPLELRRATNEVLLDAIEQLAVQDEREADILRFRFMEGRITRRVAYKVHASTDQVNRWQRSAISNLTQIIYGQEIALRDQRRLTLESSIPAPPYSRLFGFERVQSEIADQLIRGDGAWIVAIIGIGGIGKTSLADAAVRDTIDSLAFDKILWSRVNARTLSGERREPGECFERLLTDLAQQLWPSTPLATTAEIQQRLRLTLREKPHLVVIDNLVSTAMTLFILERVRELTNPSKFLLTSRSRPTVSASAYFVSLEELPLTEAGNLLRFHAKAIGLAELAEATDLVIESIYNLTGGNPLALKLVTSLASVLPLASILSDLEATRPGPIEDLYRYIYWESWRTLSSDAQALLQAMPLVAESGALPEQMKEISSLVEKAFWPAVTELITRSLLEVRGSIHDRRYGIHHLTDSFLRTDIIHWTDE